MDFDFSNLQPTITIDMQDAIDTANRNRKHVIEAAKIQELTTAEPMGKFLCAEIIRYQNSLKETEDVALLLTQFNQDVIILVDEISYAGYNMLLFRGKDTVGKPQELIQHISQLNFLLMPVPKDEPESPKRKIGFVTD